MQAYLFPQETYNAKTMNARPLDSAKASNVSSSLKKDHRSSERTGQPGLDYGAQQDWLQVNSKEKIPENNWRRTQKKVLPGPEWGAVGELRLSLSRAEALTPAFHGYRSLRLRNHTQAMGLILQAQAGIPCIQQTSTGNTPTALLFQAAGRGTSVCGPGIQAVSRTTVGRVKLLKTHLLTSQGTASVQ